MYFYGRLLGQVVQSKSIVKYIVENTVHQKVKNKIKLWLSRCFEFPEKEYLAEPLIS